MKKFLLSMAVLLGALSASADVTVDFAAATNLPTAESETATAATIDGVDFSFVYCKKGTYQQASYLQVSGKANEGKAYFVATLPADTKSIVVTTGTSGSTNVKLQMSVDGGDNIGEPVALSEKGADFTFAIPEAYQAKGTKLKFLIPSGCKYNAQLTKMVFSTEGSGTVTPDPEPSETVAKSVAEIKALNDGDKFTTDFALTVGWVFVKNIFVCDEKGDFIQIYGSNELKVGDVIPAGLTGSYKLYNGTTPEIENATIPAATAGTFEPKVVAASEISTALVNNVVKIKNVVLAEASPAAKENFTGKVGDIELSLRNNYTLESVPAGAYDITVVVTIYQDAPSLYVTNYEAASGDGISDITADENAPVEFFNLQGIRVAEPQAGEIVIRRQGSKVQKVLVK